jgi:hypothetical protein
MGFIIQLKLPTFYKYVAAGSLRICKMKNFVIFTAHNSITLIQSK